MKIRKNCFVKISGGMLDNKEVLNLIKELRQEYFVVICVGGGEQINEAFNKANIPIEFGPLGRILDTLEKKQLARNILEKNQAKIQDGLSSLGINISVEIPVIYFGTVLCHVNGDMSVLAAYNGFDQLYCYYDQRASSGEEIFFYSLRSFYSLLQEKNQSNWILILATPCR